jgi:hypothetical protein
MPDKNAIPAPPPGFVPLDSAQAPPPDGFVPSDQDAQAQPRSQDTGPTAAAKRFGSNIIHMPGAIFDAFTRPPQDIFEEQAANSLLSGTDSQLIRQLSLGLHRLIEKPMQDETEKADKYQKKATGSTNVPDTKLGFDFSLSGKTQEEKFQHLANIHRLASVIPMVGPMAGDITERFLGTGDQPYDPSGAATELALNIAAPKATEGLTKLGIGAVNKAVGRVAPAVAERMYRSSLKPSATNTPAENLRMVRTGLEASAPISESGVGKLSNLISDLNDKIEAEIASNPNAPINKFKVASRLNAPAQRFTQQVAPTSDLAHVSNVGQEFLETQPGTIRAEDAQALKKGTYKSIGDRQYGEAATARTEAEKALARGLKEELEQHFPEIKGLNAEESKYIDLKTSLERAVNRAANGQKFRLSGPVAGTIAGGATGLFFGHEAGTAVGAATWAMKTILDDPALQSHLALAINKAGHGRIPYDLAHYRVQQYVNTLAQSVNTQDQSGTNQR